MVYLHLFQKRFSLNIAKIKGLEQVKMIRAGYAIEYDYVIQENLKQLRNKKN